MTVVRDTGLDHFVVIDLGYDTTLYGVFDSFEDAVRSIHEAWAQHPSNRRFHRPDIQLWRGDGYVQHWKFDGDELVEIDFR